MVHVFDSLRLVYPMLPVSLRLVYPMLPVSLRLVYPMLPVSLRLVYPMLPVSLDYHFLIASSVFSNLYLVPCCDVSCDFRIKTMFRSYLLTFAL
jgi:hypothetical protein